MAYPAQSRASGTRNYPTSPLRQRNGKLQRAADLAPLRQGGRGAEKFEASQRVMTAAVFVANGPEVEQHINAGREPYLLIADGCNDGHFLPVAIYDVVLKQQDGGGLCEFDLHAGPVLVKPDTLIYWK